MKYMEKHTNNLFNEEMTSNEARSVFFKALEEKGEKEIKKIEIAYSKIIPKIIEKEMRLAEDGWMID